jgi:hypothetical protein
MSERISPSSGRVVAGVFLCLTGICMVALGGGCTALWLIFGTHGPAYERLLLVLCIAIFIAGIFAIREGRKMFAPPPDSPEAETQAPPDA